MLVLPLPTASLKTSSLADMTETEYILMLLKMISLFFVLGLAYAISLREGEDDDDDDDEGMYQPAYNRI